jgi:hypothetical protein
MLYWVFNKNCGQQDKLCKNKMTTMNLDLSSLAYENGLEYIESVEGGHNGYPSGIRGGIIGFSSFEEAHEFALKYDLFMCTFHKRDGWNMFERQGQPYEAMKITASDYGDDYDQYSSDDLEDFYEDHVKPFLSDFDDFDGLEDFLSNQKEIYEKLTTIDDTQLVITCNGGYLETIEKESMEWRNDSHTWIIGVTK